MSLKNKVAQIASKFKEPRGVLRKTEQGAELVIERKGGKPFTISGKDKPKVAEMYNEMFGPEKQAKELSQIPMTPEERQKLSERLRQQKESANIENPDDATLPGVALKGGKKQSGLINPADVVADAYGKYNRGVSSVAKKIADKIYQQTSGQFLSKKQQEQDPARSVLEFGTEITVDPLSYVGPGEVKGVAKIAGAAKKSKLLENILAKLGKGAAELPSMARREELVLANKLRDMKAQEAVQFAKRQREEARWANMPMAEKEKVWKQQLLNEDSLSKGRKEFADLEQAKQSMDPDTRKYIKDFSPELSPEDAIIQSSIDMNKERNIRMSEPAKELEKTQAIDVAKILKKKKKK